MSISLIKERKQFAQTLSQAVSIEEFGELIIEMGKQLKTKYLKIES